MPAGAHSVLQGPNHADFVTAVKFRAFAALHPDNGRQIFTLEFLEAAVAEKRGHKGEHKDARDVQAAAALHQGGHETAPQPPVLTGVMHSDGAYFGEVRPQHMQGAVSWPPWWSAAAA